jgi:hypothetical protein
MVVAERAMAQPCQLGLAESIFKDEVIKLPF